MCVICHKAPGIEMPSDEDIKAMFKTNPHGAGFAIQGDIDHDGQFKVEFHKGYMDVDTLLKALHARNDLKDLRVVIHTRIKTSGETDAYTTHPFRMSNKFRDLRRLHGRGAVLFHNGVFSGLGGKVNKLASDTQDFVIGVAMHYLRRPETPSELSMAIAQQVIGSCRVIILYPNKEYQYAKFGTWTKHTDGCEYSNMNWNHTPSNYSSGSSLSSGSYHYSNKYPLNKTAHADEIDIYGCQHYAYQWPDNDCDWFNVQDNVRMDTLMKNATVEATKGNPKIGTYKVCTFTRTGNTKWLVFPDTGDFIKEDKLNMLEAKLDLQDLFLAYGADPEDDVIQFDDEETAIMWSQEASKVGDYEYKFGGKTWYLDVVEFCAYTDEGIKEYFATGEQGHVRKYLQTTGSTNKYGSEDSWEQQGQIINNDEVDLGEEDWEALMEAHQVNAEDLDEEAEKAIQEELEKQNEVDPAYGMA